MKDENEIQKIKALILKVNVPNKIVRKRIENLTGTCQKEKDEILLLLKEKRPIFFSAWMLEIASNYM